MFNRVKSKDLVFGEPYYSVDEWNGYLVKVYPFLRPHDKGLTEKEVWKQILNSPDKMIAFKGEFALFGRRACAFFKHIYGRYLQIETYGFFPELVHEILPKTTRFVILYDLPSEKLHPISAKRRQRTIDMIINYKKVGYLFRTTVHKGEGMGKLVKIGIELRRMKVKREEWEIRGIPDKYQFTFKKRLYAHKL